MNKDFRKYYDLEKVIFEDVNHRFHKNGFINAEDFFLIVIWKSNRSKSKIAKTILKNSESKDLEKEIVKITKKISIIKSKKEKLSYLIENKKFRIPIASAILTVFYPDDFTIYDVRVCNSIGAFHDLINKINFDKIWEGYVKYIEAVKNKTPQDLSLRDSDRYLWGKSFYEQLENDLKINFGYK